jgi:hypothetical protein
MNICNRGGSWVILAYNDIMARRSGVSCPTWAASSSVLRLAGGSVKAAAKTCPMTSSSSGNSKSTGPACSPATIGFWVAVPLHHVAGRVDVFRDARRLAVEMDVEHIERIAAGVHEMFEEPSGIPSTGLLKTSYPHVRWW